MKNELSITSSLILTMLLFVHVVPSYADTIIYYESDDSIKRASISDGVSSTILTDSSLIDWYIAGDFIFYTIRKTATEFETYKIRKDGTDSPELVSSSDMEIIQVVELTL